MKEEEGERFNSRGGDRSPLSPTYLRHCSKLILENDLKSGCTKMAHFLQKKKQNKKGHCKTFTSPI